MLGVLGHQRYYKMHMYFNSPRPCRLNLHLSVRVTSWCPHSNNSLWVYSNIPKGAQSPEKTLPHESSLWQGEGGSFQQVWSMGRKMRPRESPGGLDTDFSRPEPSEVPPASHLPLPPGPQRSGPSAPAALHLRGPVWGWGVEAGGF